MTAPFRGSEFVVGSFVTYRLFTIVRDLNSTQLRLRPISHTNTIYSPNEWHTSRCSMVHPISYDSIYKYCQRRWAPRLTSAKFRDIREVHGKPVLTVDLLDGLYGKPFRRAIDLSDPYFDQTAIIKEHRCPQYRCSCGFYSYYRPQEVLEHSSSLDPRITVIAAVENAGRVLHGTLGVRSERMRILGVCTRDWAAVPVYKYGVNKQIFRGQRHAVFKGYQIVFDIEEDPMCADLTSEGAVKFNLKQDGWEVLSWDALTAKYPPSSTDFLSS